MLGVRAPRGEPYFAPARRRSYTEEVADRAHLRIGVMYAAPVYLGSQTDSLCVDAAEMLESSATTSNSRTQQPLDDDRLEAPFLLHWAAAAGLDYLGMFTGKQDRPDVEPLTWAAAERGHTTSSAGYLGPVGYGAVNPPFSARPGHSVRAWPRCDRRRPRRGDRDSARAAATR